jgi:hypothetical protein
MSLINNIFKLQCYYLFGVINHNYLSNTYISYKNSIDISYQSEFIKYIFYVLHGILIYQLIKIMIYCICKILNIFYKIIILSIECRHDRFYDESIWIYDSDFISTDYLDFMLN